MSILTSSLLDQATAFVLPLAPIHTEFRFFYFPFPAICPTRTVVAIKSAIITKLKTYFRMTVRSEFGRLTQSSLEAAATVENKNIENTNFEIAEFIFSPLVFISLLFPLTGFRQYLKPISMILHSNKKTDIGSRRGGSNRSHHL